MRKIKVAIIGGGGYVGGELLRLLLFHNKVEITAVTTKTNVGSFVSEVHPNLRGITNLKLRDDPIEKIAQMSDLIFFATPHGVAMKEVPKIIDSGVKIIDLSADFRLKDLKQFELYYSKHNCPEIVEKFVYGLTEFNRQEIKNASYIANPGCYPTGALLALIPLAKKGLLTNNVVVDSKTGSSGAGSELRRETHHPEWAEDFRAYNAFRHRHSPEIYQELKKFNKKDFNLSFVPHSVPMIRGIFTTTYVFLEEKITKEELTKIYRECYDKEYFIRIVDYPRCASIRGTNFCDIGFECDGKKVVVMSAIDNLMKGAAGQAIQNMNLMFNFDEREGVNFPGIHP